MLFESDEAIDESLSAAGLINWSDRSCRPIPRRQRDTTMLFNVTVYQQPIVWESDFTNTSLLFAMYLRKMFMFDGPASLQQTSCGVITTYVQSAHGLSALNRHGQ